MTIAEQLTRAKADLDAVYQKGYTAGQSAGGGASTPTLFGEHLIVRSPQTDLNTTFTFDSETVFAWFWSVENNCWDIRPVDEIKIIDGDGVYIYDSGGECNWYCYTEDEWYDHNELADYVDRIELRILEFTSPVSVPQEFYNWLVSNNGHEDLSIYEESYALGHAEAEQDILSSCVDWNMVTTSSSCSIYFNNLSPTYYVYIDFGVTAQISDMSYTDEIVIPPEGDYVWDEGEFGELSGEEWELIIYRMRFSKDGT